MYIAIAEPYKMVYRIKRGNEFEKFKKHLGWTTFEIFEYSKDIALREAFKYIQSETYPYYMKFRSVDDIINDLNAIQMNGQKARNEIYHICGCRFNTYEGRQKEVLASMKKRMIPILDKMIENFDKGPSGFWVDDYEGCGNPKIFPEFEDGLKCGTYVSKEHFVCPYDKRILDPSNPCNNSSGCYWNCAIHAFNDIQDKEIIKKVVLKFKEHLLDGIYDNIFLHSSKTYSIPSIKNELKFKFVQTKNKIIVKEN